MRLASTTDHGLYDETKTEAQAETKKEIAAGSKDKRAAPRLGVGAPAKQTDTKPLPPAGEKTEEISRRPVTTSAGVPRTASTSSEQNPAPLDSLAPILTMSAPDTHAEKGFVSASERPREATEYERTALKQIKKVEARGPKQIGTTGTKGSQNQGIIVTMLRDAAGKMIKITVTDDSLMTY